MPYVTVVAGQVITATWGNYVRDQTIVPYASESSRTSGITSPVNGQVSTITGSTYGVKATVYNSSAPGGAAWQTAASFPVHIAIRTAGNVMSGVTGVKNAYTTGSITVKASTAYRVQATAKLSSGAAANPEFLCNVIRASDGIAIYTGPRKQQRATGEGVTYEPDFIFVTGAAETSVSLILVTNCIGGTAYDLAGSATTPFVFEMWECPFLAGAIVTPPVVT